MAAVIFVLIVGRAHRRQLIMFWLLLAAVDLVALILMAMTVGHNYPGAGFFAYTWMPISAAVSLTVGILVGLTTLRPLLENKQRRNRHLI